MNPVEHKPHPVEPEEVMALHDGELESADAGRVQAHLRECAECAKLAEELTMVSQQVQGWPVEACPEAVVNPVLKHQVAAKPFTLTSPSVGRGRTRLALQLLAAAAVVLVVAVLSIPNLLHAPGRSADLFVEPSTARANRLELGQRSKDERSRNDRSNGGQAPRTVGEAIGTPKNAPMVIRTVGLTILAEDFDETRASLDRILITYNGFAAQLSVTDSKGSAQTLTAVLRVPAEKLAGATGELKKLGRVENETQNGEEVTQQYTDLSARLSNARNTEQRLIAVLQQRTGKVADILEVEQEIARVRESIEVMDAQRRTMENQVRLATIQLQVRENYKASLQMAPPTTGTRLWNAFAGGIRDASDSLLAPALFVLNAGPTLLLWIAILFLPARFAWRRVRPMLASSNIA